MVQREGERMQQNRSCLAFHAVLPSGDVVLSGKVCQPSALGALVRSAALPSAFDHVRCSFREDVDDGLWVSRRYERL